MGGHGSRSSSVRSLAPSRRPYGALDPQKRLVIVLRYWLDLSVEEIAGGSGVPVGTVASRLSRALSQLRVVLGGRACRLISSGGSAMGARRWPGPDGAGDGSCARVGAGQQSPSATGRQAVGILAIGGTVLAAVAIGVAIGSFAFAGSGTAAGPRGLGFLPAEGWTVLQSGTPATPDRPGVALAANVPLHPQDTVDGFPYSTLRFASRARCRARRELHARWRSRTPPLSSCRSRFAKPCRTSATAARCGRSDRSGQYELHATVEDTRSRSRRTSGTREPASAVLADAQRPARSPGRLARGRASRRRDASGSRARRRAVTLAFQRYYDAELYVLQGSLLRADLERRRRRVRRRS